MSSKIEAAKYLEEIQKAFIIERYGEEYLKEFITFNSQDVLQKRMEEYINRIGGYMSKYTKDIPKILGDIYKSNRLRTKYEMPHYYLLLETYVKIVENCAKKFNISLENRSYFGTACTGNFNAFACRIPYTNESLIVFEDELFSLCNFFSKIIVSAIPNWRMCEDGTFFFDYGKKAIHKQIKDNPKISENFFELLNNSFYNRPSNIKEYLIDESLIKPYTEIINSLYTFILGHEYGHIMYEHIDRSQIKSTLCGDTIIEQTIPNWEMELEADNAGLFFVFNASYNSTSSPEWSPFYLIGAELFFCLLDVIEKFTIISNTGAESSPLGSDTHPPSHLRLKKIREITSNVLKDKDLQVHQIVSKLCNSIIDTLWSMYKSAYIKNK